MSPRALKAYGLTQNRSRTNILHEPIITSLLEPTRGSFRIFALFLRKISFVCDEVCMIKSKQHVSLLKLERLMNTVFSFHFYVTQFSSLHVNNHHYKIQIGHPVSKTFCSSFFFSF